MKVVYVTGTRADYGLMKNNLLALKNDPEIELFLIVTGMHLHQDFKSSYEEIKQDFEIYKEIDTIPRMDSFEEIPLYIADTIIDLQKIFKEIKQDFTIILGDRPEALSTAITSATMNIPIIHLGGGHSSGNIDDPIRHTISQFSKIHLVSSKKCKEKLKSLGITENIHIVSASGVDSIKKYHDKLQNKEEIFSKLGLNPDEKLLVVLYHPEDNQKDTEKGIFNIIEAIKSHQTLFLYSNLDPGGRFINKTLETIKSDKVKVCKNLFYLDYLSLIKNCDVLIGNSSSGLIEAPTLKTAFVCVGNREKNREFAENIIHVKKVTKENIAEAISKALSEEFKEKVNNCTNPYDNGDTSAKLLEVIKNGLG